ncbi:hypothetical protein CDAR_23301 [Caerostris darwini]|uniref:SHSP domain-containing protein n=1 Tax=Caerostris darwini TaxID=1538125 RepID=A0AAV4T569_9ARAC|nr:hypothetical protein CDAR_23301 [Caerostris darwini]
MNIKYGPYESLSNLPKWKFGDSSRPSNNPPSNFKDYLETVCNAAKSRSSKKVENDFLVKMDVKDFRPDEIKAWIDGKSLVIQCKHEEHDAGQKSVLEEMNHRYQLPDDVEETPKLSLSKGVLTFSVPRKRIERPKVINIPIMTEKPDCYDELPSKVTRQDCSVTSRHRTRDVITNRDGNINIRIKHSCQHEIILPC